MKTIFCILALFLPASAYSADGDLTLHALRERLLQATTKEFDEAKIESTPDSLTISHNTIPYQIHSIDKTGEVSDTAHEEIGPRSNGFIITITRQKGEYMGAAILPQTIARPYWKTYATAIPVDQEQGHLHVTFSYGRKLSEDSVATIINAIKQK